MTAERATKLREIFAENQLKTIKAKINYLPPPFNRSKVMREWEFHV
jgi:hypothetical protein